MEVVSVSPFPAFVADQVRFSAWATRRMLDGLASLAEDEIDRDLSSSFTNIRGTIAHMYSADRWLYALIREERPPLPEWLAEQGRGVGFAQIAADYRSLLDACESGLDRLEGQDGEAFAAGTVSAFTTAIPRWEAITNGVSHGTYHRGQVACHTRQLGHRPPDTDLIRYYFERSGRGWPVKQGETAPS